jgi:hypothetical protein
MWNKSVAPGDRWHGDAHRRASEVSLIHELSPTIIRYGPMIQNPRFVYKHFYMWGRGFYIYMARNSDEATSEMVEKVASR